MRYNWEGISGLHSRRKVAVSTYIFLVNQGYSLSISLLSRLITREYVEKRRKLRRYKEESPSYQDLDFVEDAKTSIEDPPPLNEEGFIVID